jgi:hypothetical protein
MQQHLYGNKPKVFRLVVVALRLARPMVAV